MAEFEPTRQQLSEWLRMESSLRLMDAHRMRDSGDPDEARMWTGYLASSRWLERASEALAATPREGA